MSDSRWRRQWEIFHAAVDLAREERASFLERSCKDDPDLRREVEALLRGHEQDGGALDRPPVEPVAFELDVDELIGQRLGRYEIIEPIGEGGMGVVLAARQLEPVQRPVALKLIKLGMDTREVVARFESERRVLAMMSHPGIAAVLDCGSTLEGRPYFVMELVDGLPITRYCESYGASLEERVELLARVCDAVQHAHRKGVVHRDIKPSNVLVVESEGGAVPKVIDFGVAKAVSPAGSAPHTMLTQAGRVIGTPEYMSPEQAELSPDIDTQTDVYSLGVMLYELLTGSLPFDFSGKSYSEIQSMVRLAEPPLPSRRLLSGEQRTRGGDASSRGRKLRGDLDWIVMKALAKERAERYGSAGELALDLRRFLRDEPVSAGPPGAAYRLRKLVKRHRGAALGVAAAGLTLLVGIVASSWFALIAAEERAAADAARIEAEAARDRARREAARAEAVNDVLFDMLESPDPTRPTLSEGEAREVKVVDVLARAAASADEVAEADPGTAANVHDVVGRMYVRLGLYDAAERELGAAHDARTALLGEDHPETLGAAHDLATAIDANGRVGEAAELFENVLDARRSVLGEDHEDTIATAISLANARVANGELEAAEPIFRDALERGRRVLGETDDRTLSATTGLGFILNRRGEPEAAEPLYRSVYEGRRDTLGPDHPGTLSAANNLAAVLQGLGRLPEAERLYADLLERYERVLGPEHANTLNVAGNYAVLLYRQGKPADAEVIFRRVAQSNERSLGAGHRQTLIARNNLARMLIEQKRYQDALALYEDMLPRAHRAYPAGHVNLALFRGGYGLVLTEVKRYADAETELTAAYRGLSEAVGADHPQTLSQVRRLVALYEARGETERAASYRALLPEGS